VKPDVALKALPVLVDVREFNIPFVKLLLTRLVKPQDMRDNNPLIRALALRTITYIHVREFVEAAVPSLRSLLRDTDPYVRKTAAFGVAKLYDHDKKLVEGSDLIDKLNTMLRDDNPTVVSSALAALMDIWERSDTIKLTIDYASASKIVQILPDCSE
jgi:vesicle coat complex subunit